MRLVPLALAIAALAACSNPGQPANNQAQPAAVQAGPQKGVDRSHKGQPAPDAVLLDTTEMSISAAADAARRIVEAARTRWEQSQG